MQSHPLGEGVTGKIPGGQLENHSLLFLDVALNPVTVKNEKRFHGRMADPFVSVQEGMIHDKRVAQGSGLGDETMIEIPTAEGSMRLTISRLKCTKIADPGSAAGGGEQPLMEIKHLGD